MNQHEKEQRLAELSAENAELRRQLAATGERALRASERRYRSLFESLPVCMWEEDFSEVKAYIDGLRADGVEDFRHYFREHPDALDACADKVRVVDVNRATVDTFGGPNREAHFGPMGEHWSGGVRDVFCEELCALAEGQTSYEGEGVSRDAAGRTHSFSIRLALAADHEGAWDRVWVAVTDTTQRHEAQQAARAAAQEAVRLATAHDMIATLQHEINNPLQGVLGFAEYLVTKVDEDHEFGDIVRKIFRGAVRIEELVHRLEGMVRVESKPYLGQGNMIDLQRSTSATGILSD